MGCDCSLENKDSHLISPTESCILCCQKHFSYATGEYIKTGFEFPNKYIIVGELNLAFYHTRLEFQNISIKLSNLNFKILNGGIDIQSDLEELSSDIENEIDNQIKIDNDKYVNGQVTYDQEKTKSNAILSIATAWRLAEELGYSGINRNLIINELVNAQICIDDINHDLAEEIKTLRYEVMRLGKTGSIELSHWTNIMIKLDSCP